MNFPNIRRQLGIGGRAPTAREILHAILEQGHAEAPARDGSVRITLTLSADTFDAWMAWDDAHREDEEVDYERDARLAVTGGGS